MTTTLAKDTAARSRRSAQSASISDLVSLRQKLLSFVGSGSFTTMQTALNSLAGHYANYANRPLPEALHDRLAKELNKAVCIVDQKNLIYFRTI